jgi:hypothetical protein
MIAAAVALFLMEWNDVVSRLEGALLVLGGMVYSVALVRVIRRERASVPREFSDQYGDVPPRRERLAAALRNAGFLIAGFGRDCMGRRPAGGWSYGYRAHVQCLRCHRRAHHRCHGRFGAGTCHDGSRTIRYERNIPSGTWLAAAATIYSSSSGQPAGPPGARIEVNRTS